MISWCSAVVPFNYGNSWVSMDALYSWELAIVLRHVQDLESMGCKNIWFTLNSCCAITDQCQYASTCSPSGTSSCSNSYNSHTCHCTAGFTGLTCSQSKLKVVFIKSIIQKHGCTSRLTKLNWCSFLLRYKRMFELAMPSRFLRRSG